MRILSLLFCVFLFQISVTAQEIEVMTYNIKYANENDGENSWSKRKDWITNQIHFYEPDVLGVQEALKSQLDHFTDHITSYKMLGVGRDGEDKGEYSAILYKQEKFEVLESNTFWLSETPDKISIGWDAALNRICTYALFEDKASGKKFWIFNTHFDHMGEKARLESSRLIVQKIKAMNQEDLPVFLMGDFNLEPDTEGVGSILSYLDDAKQEAEYTFGPAGTFNGYNFSEPVTRRIDCIFINDKVEVEKYAVISDSKDLKYPSDHLPVLVKAKLIE
ncbi:endonuclease/exonuclease/phosphatase family metal-dependent hydrolase [Christiangramia gaetbulicola]|uniref:Endonuclease/exonuclease/phosphatase family metal-dependent hydrolase n=1 Tax=Christiangramia gaetbulicola TaxID=703340 RepID=A0A2T6AEH7_9FLAO|nr:endonuclease/exonuclease/phosphatase family protein [Christiangramia gaetbulicola]PTX42192.1 endonuclease/exonuclease/phosphatase family metal-dependent hydrolase [Christiangramia gaetbulicola]